jgi:hypothetical protein
MCSLAEKAAAVFKADYAGVDIMYDEEGKPYVLEVIEVLILKVLRALQGLNAEL